MKLLFWLSTASSTFCASQNCPFTAAGSATSMPTLMSLLTWGSWTGLTGPFWSCSTSAQGRKRQICPLLLSYRSSWGCGWAQFEPTMASWWKSLKSRHKPERVWYSSTPATRALIPATRRSASYRRRPAIWRSLAYSIHAEINTLSN